MRKEASKTSKAVWDRIGEHLYENGVSHAVLFTPFPSGEPTNFHASTVTFPSTSGAVPGRMGLYVNNFGTGLRNEYFVLYPAIKADEYNGEFGEGAVVEERTIASNKYQICKSCVISSYEIYNTPNDKLFSRLTNFVRRASLGSGQEFDPDDVDVVGVNYGGSSPATFINFSYTYQGETPAEVGKPNADWTPCVIVGRYATSREYTVDQNTTLDFAYNSGFNRNSNDATACCSYFATVWNGITGITESPDGADANDMWADNMKYSSPRSTEQFGLTVEAYMYPDQFGYCDGTVEPVAGVKVGQQSRMPFCLAYRTEIGNDTTSESDDGYLLHLVYNLTASPSDRSYETINDSPDAITFSWELSSNPVVFEYEDYKDYKPISNITINSKTANATALEWLETFLYGSSNTEGSMPSPDGVLYVFSQYNNV